MQRESLTKAHLYPVGARVLIRDAEWRITRVELIAQGGYRLSCVGLSSLVRGKQAQFLTIYDKNIKLLKPEETELVPDTSAGFIQTKLYIEAQVRSSPITDPSKIYVAYKAAMDPLPYQFDPALKALAQPRARILIADAVGIGKTLEAGILTSELIARGRGKRILVVATKAVLPQFQQEFWNRFSIPLTRLDSVGIERVRNRIPTNHNPFLYFDKSIISVDTLKQDSTYREYLKDAHWDLIIIDEAHNVADRGSSSQRSKLAKLLADCSDSMIMLSATPHDGRSESFASLLNILDPTAIADPHNYTVDDFADKGLVIRRFKNNVKSQVRMEFPERSVTMVKVIASKEENAAYQSLSGATFSTLDQKHAKGARLFSTTLTKALFSSPDACASVIEHRIAKLQNSADSKAKSEDIEKLQNIARLVEKIQPREFAKFNRLVSMLSEGPDSIGWNRAANDDRIVVFTESVVTLNFLANYLPKALGLAPEQFRTLSGSMKDTDIADVVNNFNKGSSPVRLLLASDVASEGVNLHHFAHRMIHFDIPWSLMVFQQRNGRIDRYGQEKKPEIYYLQTIADEDKASADARILQRLQEKDARAQENLSDPAEFMLTQQEQEDKTAAEMEGHAEPTSLSVEDDPWLAFYQEGLESDSKTSGHWTKISPVLTEDEYEEHKLERPSLFASDMAFAQEALRWMNKAECWSANELSIENRHRFLLQAPPDLAARLKYLPREVLPEGARFDMTDSSEEIQEEMQHMRSSGSEWPTKQLLWPLHPVMDWIRDRALSMFGRHRAPLIALSTLPKGENWFLLQGGFPNRSGYIPVHRWVAVCQKEGKFSVNSLQDAFERLGLRDAIVNRGTELNPEAFTTGVQEAVQKAAESLQRDKLVFEAEHKMKLAEQLAELAQLKQKHVVQMELRLGVQIENVRKARETQMKKELERHFNSAERYIRDTADLEDNPYLQLVAVFAGV